MDHTMSGIGIDGTFVNVENECAMFCAQIDAMKKKIRIKHEMLATVEKRIEDEMALKREEDKQIEHLLNEIDKLEVDIDQKKQDIDCLKTSCQNTDDIVNKLLLELDAKNEQQQQEHIQFEELSQSFLNDLELTKQSYIDVPVHPRDCGLETVPIENTNQSSNEQIGEQSIDGHLSSQTTLKLINETIAEQLAEDVHISDDLFAANAEAVLVGVTTAQQEIGFDDKPIDDTISQSNDDRESVVIIEHSDPLEQIAEQIIAEPNSQTADTLNIVNNSSGEPSMQPIIPSSGEFCDMFANLFQSTPSASVDTGFKFALNLGDSGDSSPAQNDKTSLW